ncbi:type II toxin-antitoxin system RelE/ParE family toxin [Halomonas sp. A40-4]|uniref:type II toxin-antitoxin system RelE/ParE family toxin n=1 Tax=Halomonas sp. A40-4 TaxID=2785909 RepID=UPI0019382938|nr:type II toxin-antitoxin system RelE/ParE family toxin [Halomonas sp. A40-4]QPL46833.1 type II toxin-antitoxin system RelE/ParE family toxin [Halomonas sp. A40-4]
MIKSFRHKGLKRFYATGSTAGIQSDHAKKLRMQLAALDTSTSVEDMDIPRGHPQGGPKRLFGVALLGAGFWRIHPE